jgi:DNA mismatch repair protein MSH6
MTPRKPIEATTPKSSKPTSTPKSTKSEKFKEKNDARYSWLLDIRDSNGNSPGTVHYDPRTLFIPKQAWNSFTPFEKQFWEIKSKNWDTVVFFKKGKFFELYENDADIGHQHFDLKLTDRVNMKMVGVPENSFHHWASQFIAKGYKVAKVEQMENSVGKQIRDKQTNKKEDKIIKRELTCVLTSGTLVDSAFLTSDMSTYCMAIKEVKETEHLPPKFGIAFVDTATAELNITFFQDDHDRTQFETLITQINPKELVLEKNNLSKETMKILRNNLKSPQMNFLTPTTEFWTSEITMDELLHGQYFEKVTDIVEEIPSNWPTPFKLAFKEPVAFSALGGLLSYLKTVQLFNFS